MAYWADSGDDELGFYEDDFEEAPQRSSYTPEISSAAIRAIILAAMEKENVVASKVPHEGYFTTPTNAERSKRYFEVKGFAWFSCPKKHHRWPSAQSWCFMDLKTQAICYRDQQECKKCESKASPEFSREALERMAEYMVKKFLIRTGRKRAVYVPRSTDTEDTQGGPHDQSRCDRCKRLGRSCWK